MSNNLPLYDNLFKETTNEDLTTKEKEDFIKLIKNIDQNGFEMAYALIRIYQLENHEDKSTFKIPYGGKFINEDIMFNLHDLPCHLKQILYKFLIIHTKAMKEDNSTETEES